jgi:hypothetical protein
MFGPHPKSLVTDLCDATVPRTDASRSLAASPRPKQGNALCLARRPSRLFAGGDFVFEGNEIRGLEQNPETKSRCAQMARPGKKVMQFVREGRYVANVVDGKVTMYGRPAEKS